MLGDFLGISFASIFLNIKRCALKDQKHHQRITTLSIIHSLLINYYKLSQRFFKYFGTFNILKLNDLDTF